MKVYALRKSKLNGYDIFRLKESSMAIFVSEKIKKIVEENQISGCDFLEVKTY